MKRQALIYILSAFFLITSVLVSAETSKNTTEDVELNRYLEQKKEEYLRKKERDAARSVEKDRIKALRESRKLEKQRLEELFPTHTLFPGVDIKKSSAYAAPFAGYTKLGSQHSVISGLRAGWILEKKFVLGASVSGLSQQSKISHINGLDEYSARDFGLGYGGVLLEYYFFPSYMVHLSIGVTAGAGGLAAWWDVPSAENENEMKRKISGEIFFVAEPELTVWLNVAKFCRLGLGGYYRYTQGINKNSLEDGYFRGFGAAFKVAFGWF